MLQRPTLALLALLLLSTSAATSASAAPRPRLGVLVIFDQMPSWLLERYAPFFPDSQGGFGGLDGARFDAVYPYAGTETAPGHATLATGALPAVHGIATNSWFWGGKKLYAVDDPAFPTFSGKTTKADYGRSPRMLLTNTLGDAMKNESGGRARVVTLSHKDRAAVLTAGHAADLAVWYDPALGRFTSSTAYVSELPAWLDELGAALPAKAFAEGTWSPLPIPKGLEMLAADDDRPGEGALKGYDATFPHDLKDIADKAVQRSGYRLSPQSISDLFTLALRAVDEEKLGADDEPDLLVISVSTTDVVGHNYGGESLEQLDTLRRGDLELRRFIQALQGKLGRQNVVVALSSDHGAPELPQTISKSGLALPTLVYADVIDAAERAAQAFVGGGGITGDDKKNPKNKTAPSSAPAPTGRKRVQGFFPPQLFLDESDLDPVGRQRLRDAVAAAVEALPGIEQVYDMTPGLPDEDPYMPFMRASAPPHRSASLFVRWAPRVLLLEERGQTLGTDHGTPYIYDRRVPFIIAGPGVRRGRYSAPVDPRDVAPTLAFLLGVSPPDSCQGKPVPAVGDR